MKSVVCRDTQAEVQTRKISQNLVIALFKTVYACGGKLLGAEACIQDNQIYRKEQRQLYRSQAIGHFIKNRSRGAVEWTPDNHPI